MLWTVYNMSGNPQGTVEASSLTSAYNKARRNYRDVPPQGGVALQDDRGYGYYHVILRARPLGSQGSYYQTVGGVVQANSARQAMEKIRTMPGRQNIESGSPIHIEFHGPSPIIGTVPQEVD